MVIWNCLQNREKFTKKSNQKTALMIKTNLHQQLNVVKINKVTISKNKHLQIEMDLLIN